jgi:ApaG protein
MYERITRDIRVTVRPEYLEEQSKPDENYFVWAYTIVIENLGNETVTLKTRYWKITDSTGRSQEVRGAGVVGEQPTLGPGESFQYTSGAPLTTASGFMAGATRWRPTAAKRSTSTSRRFPSTAPRRLTAPHSACTRCRNPLRVSQSGPRASLQFALAGCVSLSRADKWKSGSEQ